MTELLRILDLVPNWFVYMIHILFNIFLLKSYLKIFIGFVLKLQEEYMSESSADSFYTQFKIIAIIIILFDLIFSFFISNSFSTLLSKAPIYIMCLITITYVNSARKALSHIIFLKYNAHLLEEKTTIYMCGEILKEDNGYYFDYVFRDEKIKLL